MEFQTLGDKNNPAILFFHALGVSGASSIPVAKYLKDKYYLIMPTYSAFCDGAVYQSKQDEIKQLECYLQKYNINSLELVVASSLGADIATTFITQTSIKIKHVFFDGGQFAQLSKVVRCIMTPFLYVTIKSLYWSKGKTLRKIMWCADDNIKPYFIEAGKNLDYKSMRNLMMTNLENKEFPPFSKNLQQNTFWAFGDKEEHYKYREAVKKAYPYGEFPIFNGMNHMQLQIKNPKKFADILLLIIERKEEIP